MQGQPSWAGQIGVLLGFAYWLACTRDSKAHPLLKAVLVGDFGNFLLSLALPLPAVMRCLCQISCNHFSQGL